MVGVGVIGAGFKWFSGGPQGAAELFQFATNPIIGLLLGTLATALVQSSSTVTSVIVALVAGGLPIEVAIPMVMGANMGTTITNTIVSLGNIGEKKAFNRSFSAATVHDFFNLYAVIIFLPIEIFFHPLQRMADVMAHWFVDGGSISISSINLLPVIIKPLVNYLRALFEHMPGMMDSLAFTAFGIALVFFSVIYMGRTLKKVMTGRAKALLDKALGKGIFVGILAGTLITMIVQSSSTTTSLLVPIAGAGIITLRHVFPFTLGANIGTTVTALLAATAVVSGNKLLAIEIALIHFLFNVLGVLLFVSVPWLYQLPIRTAEWLGELTEKNRGYAFGYIFGVFFVIPGTIFGGQSILQDINPEVVKAEQNISQVETIDPNPKD
ncbi:MAG: sodium:phosphate symporter [Thermodesulfobacteriota bacterium]|nr:MAG: sodium:phosphate symporter [Thermodesulfobacteriota bacterium]